MGRTKGATKDAPSKSGASKDAAATAVLPADPGAIVPGVRYYTEKPSTQSWISSALACVTLSLFAGWIHLLTLMFVLGLYFRSYWLLATWATIVATVLLPAQTHWQAFLDAPLFASWRQYFSYSIIFDTKMDPKRKFMFAHVPHGVYPFSQILAGTVADRLFKGIKCYAVSASNVFAIPVIKHIFSWIGAQPATRRNFERLLSAPGSACGVVVDGLAGMYQQDPNVEKIVLQTRRGFIKVALKQGADLVPLYHFGNTRLLSVLGKSLQRVSRATRLPWMILYGRFGLPIPRRSPLMVAIGTPIRIEKTMDESDPGFKDEVERLHKLFCAGVIDTFKKYRGVYDSSWSDLPIKIVK